MHPSHVFLLPSSNLHYSCMHVLASAFHNHWYIQTTTCQSSFALSHKCNNSCPHSHPIQHITQSTPKQIYPHSSSCAIKFLHSLDSFIIHKSIQFGTIETWKFIFSHVKSFHTIFIYWPASSFSSFFPHWCLDLWLFCLFHHRRIHLHV